MALRIYNTLTRRVEEFTPLHAGEVRMYVCGPNLYGPSHVGHALSFLVFDVIHRYLEYRGYRVKHVQNFTDIEDRIIQTAQEQGTTVAALAEQYAARFLREMDQLGVRRADHYPRATEVIPKMLEMIRGLVDRGVAYAVEGDVFFRVTAFPAYGRLSGRSLDEMQAGARIDVDPRKAHPMDFVLWKAAKPGEPSWDSPWGPGRPGWHIECSAMSISLLGDQLDLHGGGQDVVFPHHENEIAQSEAYTGKAPFVRFWVHNGLLRLSEGQEKMTRHLGNIVTIEEALRRYHPDAIRVFVFSSHYRSPTLWSEESLAAATHGAERLRTAAEHVDTTLRRAGWRGGGAVPARAGDAAAAGGSAEVTRAAAAAREAFEQAMDDDFNTPRALAAIFDLATALNRGADVLAKAAAPAPPSMLGALAGGSALLSSLAGVLGLRLTVAVTPEQRRALHGLARELVAKWPQLFPADHPLLAALRAGDGASADELIEFVAGGRTQARRQRDWATSDAIRARLQALGILLEDSPTGVTWRVR
ncbi:MAG TPA: cysteine--tRNA ligase [bacterium]|nr:cysteine--tRNA ligase [bacterium]